MVEKIKGISIKGRCFTDDTMLKLYPNQYDRISIVYGKNGSGKSTISMGFQNLVLDSFASDISLNLLDQNNAVLNADDYRNSIFVFNEQYIDRNVKIDDDGLGTIILLGGQVDLQDEIDQHTILETEKKQQWEKEQEKLDQYKNKSNPLSPEYHLDLIRSILKKSGGWSETDSKIKGNKQNSAVRDDVLFEICKLAPTDSIENLKQKYDEKKNLLDKISDASLSFPLLSNDKISIENGYERTICDLLSRIIEKAVLTEREKQILAAIENGQQSMIESAKKVFSENSTTHCPYCYQPIHEDYKRELLNSINRVLNKDVEDHKAELKGVSFPLLEDDYSKYDNLDSLLVKKIEDQKAKCNSLIKAYEDQIQKKLSNIYTPISIKANGLEEEIENLNSLLKQLSRKIAEFNNAISRRKKIVEELVSINKELAHFDVVTAYRGYDKQNKDKQTQEKKVEVSHEEYQNESRKLKELQLKKSNIGLAITNINNALEYVFFSKNRLSIELRNDKYYLKSNGKDVRPKNVSLGERNIVALCYFFTQMMSNQEVAHFYQSEALVIIDDPVSSFDFENRVGILSLIRYQVDCLIKRNQQSKVLILTHDLTTAFDLRKAMDEVANSTKGIAQIQKTSSIQQELSNNQLIEFRKTRNEYGQLLSTIYKYANDEAIDHNLTIGNIMRRALEAFSTFNYRKGIEDVSCDPTVLCALGDHSVYFNNLMYRLVLHGESHSEERIYSLRDDTNFYEFVSENEKKKTAKDILCFMYLLVPAHIQAYLQSESNAIATIKQWCSQIKDNASFLLEKIPSPKNHKIRLYDFPLSAGIGNDIDGTPSFSEYYTDEQNCDFALKVSGDSMEPDIPGGSVVLIKKCECVDEGKIGAFFYDGQIYCKRMLSQEGKSYLESINKNYPPIIIQPESVFKVYGVVVGVEKE